MERIDGVKSLFYLCLFAILSTDLLSVHGQSIETVPQNLTTAESHPVNLLCRTNSPLSYCRFEIPGERVLSFSDAWESKNPNYKYYGNGLAEGFCGVSILHVKLANNGPVKCFLGLQGEEIHSQIELTVAYAPQQPKIKILTKAQNDGAYAIDQDIEAICESRDGRPPAKLSWFLNEEPIFEGLQKEKILDGISQNSTVYLVQQILRRRLQASDDGKYLICRAEHPAGHPQDTQVPIQVRYRPQPQQEIYVYGLNLGETALVNVTINSNPPPRTEWSVDGLPISEGEQKNRYESYRPVDLGNGKFNVTLSIAGLTAEDTSKAYIMKAFNQFGTTDYLIHITSSPKSIETGIDVGSIVGIIVGVAILLVIVSVIVFARATGKWCFSGRSDEKPVTSETSDTESHVYADKSEKRKFALNFNLNNLFKNRSKDGKSSQPNDVEDGKLSNDEDDNAAPSESTVIVEDEPTKKDVTNLVYAELVLKQSDEPDTKVSKNSTEYAEIVYKPNADKPTEEPKK